jgi:CheY-like chemotaxis protein
MTERDASKDRADILLVEDNPGDIRLTREAFRESQIANELHVVTDGVEALDFLHKDGEYTDAPRPDIILLDLNLPRKNGNEFLKELHEDSPDLAWIPVIILTSSKTAEDIVQSYEL